MTKVDQKAATMLGDLLEVRDAWLTLHYRLSRMSLDDDCRDACDVISKYLGSGHKAIWEDSRER